MLIVTGIVELDSDRARELVPLAARTAEATRREEGCLAYAFYEDIERPGRFRIYEEWADQAALDAHLATPHLAKFARALAATGLGTDTVVKYETGAALPVRSARP